MCPYLDMTQLLNRRFNDRISSLCRPFFHTFNLCHFWYYKLLNDGRLSYLGSFAEWNEIFAAERLFQTYVCHPQFYKQGITLRRQGQNPHIKRVCESWERKFGTHQTLVFINKLPEGVEEFGFVSSCPHDAQTDIFLNEAPLFRLFIQKFREEKSLFSRINEIQINVANLIGSDFYKDQILHPKEIDKQALLKELGFEPILSRREKQILQLMLQGFPAAEIAPRALIAKRTVEHHLERIKAKLHCQSKSDLVQKARELETYGFFKE